MHHKVKRNGPQDGRSSGPRDEKIDSAHTRLLGMVMHHITKTMHQRRIELKTT